MHDCFFSCLGCFFMVGLYLVTRMSLQKTPDFIAYWESFHLLGLWYAFLYSLAFGVFYNCVIKDVSQLFYVLPSLSRLW